MAACDQTAPIQIMNSPFALWQVDYGGTNPMVQDQAETTVLKDPAGLIQRWAPTNSIFILSAFMTTAVTGKAVGLPIITYASCDGSTGTIAIKFSAEDDTFTSGVMRVIFCLPSQGYGFALQST